MTGASKRGAPLSLPAALILTALYAYWCYFFMVAGSVGLRRVAAWIVYVSVVGIFFQVLHSNRSSHYRRIFFVAIALLFFPEFIARLLETRGSMALSDVVMLKSETPFCHIGIAQIALPFIFTGKVVFPASISAVYMMLLIWAAATLLIGRGWCSWVCFYGGWDDLFSRLAKKTRLRIDPANHSIRYFGIAMLMFVALASLASLSPAYCQWLCPFKLITEYNDPHSLSTYIALIMFIVAFFALVVVLPFLTRTRTQCMAFCPLGGLQSLLNPFSLYRIRIDGARCVGCLACVQACPTRSLSHEMILTKHGQPATTCTRCGECVDVCPRQAIGLTFVWAPFVAARHAQGGSRSGQWLLRTARDLVSAKALFTFAAMLMGMVFLSSFGIDTIRRVLNLCVQGSFFLSR